jgi:hypothetical protein
MQSCMTYSSSAGGAGGCAGANGDSRNGSLDEILVEVTQVLQPICATLTNLDMTGTRLWQILNQ